MKRKYTVIVEIDDDCIDVSKLTGQEMHSSPLAKKVIIKEIESVDIAGLKIRVMPETFKRVRVLPLPKKKKTEGQLIAARRKSGRIAAKGASKDFTVSTPLKRYSRNTATPE